jgi:hypothetical protein
MADKQVRGPLGRTFNRVLGVDAARTDTGSMAFSRGQLKSYLDQQLQLAEGEWFRGKKLDGVADALMEQMDKDKDGQVAWSEFQSFRQDILKVLAPSVQDGASPEEVAQGASQTFGQIDEDGSSSLSMGELQSNNREALPEGTDHPDLVAQLGARLAIDAVDTDQRGEKVADRRLSREEWVAAARALAGG